MDINNYLKVSVPFINKAFKSKIQKSAIVHGIAYFVYDKQLKKFVKSYIQIGIGTQYRLADNDLIKTHHWKTNYETRIQLGLSNELTHSDNYEYRNLLPKEIETINLVLKFKNTTALSQYSYFTGSNPSGSEKRPQSSPMIIYSSDSAYEKYEFWNFYNSFKHETYKLKTNKATKIQWLEALEKIQEISLIDFIDKEYSLSFNEDFRNRNSQEFIPKNKSKYKTWIKDLTDNLINAMKAQRLKNWEYEAFKEKLRNKYVQNVENAIKDGLILKEQTTTDFPLPEKAHIISFSSLVKLNENNEIDPENIEAAISPYNVLLIDPNIHTLFDKNWITFNPKTLKIEKSSSRDKSDWHNFIIDTENPYFTNLAKEQKQFLEKNYQHWLIHGKNQ
ncbi:MAG4270 family putative restriction endonuclease [Mycoplasma nasistruthionis]|uniref:HNH endonuclease n=1 Tax=Mycoplasma nasistruthionis TaxID=353852 RepID=A0A4Y6I6M4_9MOLU|nr:HNH endonuclease signature motif containing protein [Mycoplasma nasistruthionis]QDF65256.1 HNH endonuclease [Mycoplasma nasistruthionis]